MSWCGLETEKDRLQLYYLLLAANHLKLEEMLEVALLGAEMGICLQTFIYLFIVERMAVINPLS